MSGTPPGGAGGGPPPGDGPPPGGPPPPNPLISERTVYVSQIFYGVTIPLLFLCVLTLGYRLSRLRTRRTTITSDICVTVGFILAVACWALYVPQSFLTSGIKTPEALIEASKGSFLSIPIWSLSMAFIKVSVGLTLLQIKNTTWFKILIWFNVGVACAYGFGNLWFILFSCRPLQAAWGDFADPTAAKCLPPEAIKTAALVGAIVSITTDIMLSLAPISFLWTLKRPLRERIVLGLLMSLGLLAGISSIIKNLIIADFGKPGLDMAAMNVSISTWTSLEMLLGVIATCTPFCRPVLERCLSKMGVSITGSKPSQAAGYNNYQRATEQDTFRSNKGGTLGGGVSSKNSSSRNIYESDEDPLATGIELQSPGRTGPGIYKQTDIKMHSDAIGPGEAITTQQQYYMGR